MNRSYKRWLLLVLVSVAPLFTACERVDDVNGISNVDAPQFSAYTSPNKRLAQLALRFSTASIPEQTVLQWVTPGQTVTLALGQYELVVPQGAIKKPTLFRMEVMRGQHVGVRLEAMDMLGNVISTFRTPLRLTLPYSDLDLEIYDPDKLVLANVSKDGQNTILEIVNVTVNRQNMTVSGSITHFSDYILGTL